MDSPAVPKPLGTDEEDVAWALATAEAMWARGDRLDAVKWIRKAAEAASEADDILRAADLASAAADLANALDPALAGPPPAPNRAALNKTMQSHKSMVAPAAKAAPPVPVRVANEVRRPSPASGTPSIRNIHTRPVQSPKPAVTAPRPAATPAPMQQRVAPLTNVRKEPPPLDATAELNALPPAPLSSRPSAPPPRPSSIPARGSTPAPARPSNRPPGLILTPSNAPPPADGWDLPHTVQLPNTRPVVDTPPEFVDAAKLTGTTPGAGKVGPIRPKINTMTEVDREVPAEVGRRAARLQASQAFHVVLWKDARGVHVAPSGTVVSAITVDAILIALDPSADLSAWLQPSPGGGAAGGGTGSGE